MKRKTQCILNILFCFLCLTLGSTKASATEDPIQMLKNVTSRTMGALKENRSDLHRHPEKIYDVVNSYILPHVDFTEMARWVVGRNAWQEANEATKREFVGEFRTMVVRTYAQSLLKYTNQTVEFTPLRGSQEGKGRVQVSSFIREPGKKPVRMDYRLLRADGNWKVYDIIIEGVSLMQGYRAQFADDVRHGGLSEVVQKLRSHNLGQGQGRK
jgi:phospholipid transport system substrate-binding protein